MTQDITPLVEAWLQEPAPLSDRGISKVAHVVQQTPQRRVPVTASSIASANCLEDSSRRT